ncbi:unnamed protein product [Paramecium sonneborni]|uniref:Uncharacterized protein n=1 Tax=Paramecium sonneborni TaxID=65129 RepID=A0A8S1R7D0_9CILI|nr:unnamed protein product [Paramecium sonneborni]
MITNHPAYPKKEIDKYYLQTKLPEYQTVPMNEHQKKTHDYYNDNTHIWNNPHQAKSNAKVFKQLKEQHVKGEKRIKQLQEKEQKEKQELQHNKIIYYNMAREEDLLRLQQRKLERGSLQNLSSQRNDVQVDSITVKPILSRTALLGRPDHLWNKLNQQCQKYVNLLVNPKILQMEEQGVKAINDKIQKDMEIQQIKEELRLQNMEHIKQQSTLRRMTNLEMEQRSGILPSRLSLQRVTTAQTNCRQPKDLIESTLQQLENQQQSQTIQQLQNQIINSAQFNQTSRPYTVGSDFNSISFNAGQAIKNELNNNNNNNNNLTQNQTQTAPIFLVNSQKSKSVSTLSHKHPLDRTEFKGLLLAQAVEQAESNFSKTLKANSSLLKETSVHFSRSKQSMIPKKRIQIKCNNNFANEQNKNDENDLQIVNNMLDSFERKLYRTNNFDDDSL